MKRLRSLISVIDRANETVGNYVLYLIPAMVAVMAYEVVARYFLNSPTVWAFETSQFLFCASISLGAGFTLLHGRHVNVDILYTRLKPRVRAILDLITLPLFMLFVGILLQLTVEVTIDSYRFMEKAASYWSPVLFPVYTAMTIGVLLMFLQGLANWLRSLITVITGQAEKNPFQEAHK